MNDENEEKKGQWIAELLPRNAALALSRAATVAQGLPVDSLARAKVIRDAEKKVKEAHPRLFRLDHGPGQ